MKPHILIYSLNYFPELIGIGKYNTEMANWLVNEGYDVDVVCAPPYYPSWKLSPGFSGWRYSCNHYGPVSVHRCPIWLPKELTGINRILHLFSFAISSALQFFWLVFQKKISGSESIIFLVEPPIFCLPAVLVVSKIFRSKVWLHVQDFEIDAGFSLGILPNFPRLTSLVGSIENWLMQKVQVVSTISAQMSLRLYQKGVKLNKCVYFPNWVDCNVIHPVEEINEFRAQLGISEDKIVCLYSGNLGAKQGLSILIDSARMLEGEGNIVFVISGQGQMKRMLVDQARDLTNIYFLDLQPLERLNSLLNMADIHLLPQASGVGDLVMPSKLKAMLASGRPVIATAHSSTQVFNIVKTCGVVVPPEQAQKLTDAIADLAKHDLVRKELGQEGRKYALSHWNRDQVLTQFEKKLRKLVFTGKLEKQGSYLDAEQMMGAPGSLVKSPQTSSSTGDNDHSNYEEKVVWGSEYDD